MNNNINILDLSVTEIKELDYEIFSKLVSDLSADEIIKLSNKVGYPVFTRLCMGILKHKFVLLQDGAAAMIVDDNGRILLQSRSDRDQWGLPGGCQELCETFEDTVIREVFEETSLKVDKKDLQLIAIVSGPTRRNNYPNGDVVINNTALYLITKYSGDLKWNNESKNMKFFGRDELPENQNDPDLIKIYKKIIV